MIRCDTCANSEHCSKIASSNSMCYDYMCNLKFSVGQTIYFARWEGGSDGFYCRCVSAKIVEVVQNSIEVKSKEYHLLLINKSKFKTVFFLTKEECMEACDICTRKAREVRN